MQNESEIFLPSSMDNQNKRRYHHIPWFSSRLFKLFEESPLYAYVLFLVFTFAVFIGTLTTYDKHYEVSVPVLFYVELALFIYCLIEFILRIYASESRIRYRGLKGKHRFFYEHYLIIDLLLLISYGLVFLLNFTKFYDSSVFVLHALRFLQLFRFIPLDRHIKSIPLISYIIWQYRRVLLAAIYLCFLLMLPTAYLLWIFERFIETNGQFFFNTYTDSLWFTINSMATIGYGDTWPQTLIGRTLTATLCCIGVVLWTLPAGIISAGLTSIDEKRRKTERLHRPAARLILAWWRLQLANNQSQSMSGKHDEKEKCKQFIAHLLYARLCREFRQYRCGNNKEYDGQIRKDIDRILQCLQIIEKKLNGAHQNLHIDHE